MSPQLPFEPPDRELSPDDLEKIARAVGEDPSLWEDELRKTTAERTYVDVSPTSTSGSVTARSGPRRPRGRRSGSIPTFIHRMRPEPGAGPTCTVHAYSPPLTDTGQYAECDDGLLHRHPSPADEQLKPHGRQGTPTTEGQRS